MLKAWCGALILVAAGLMAPTPAQADGCPDGQHVVVGPGGVGYTCVDNEPGDPGGGGGGGGGGSSQPTCDLQSPATWCDGTIPCWTQPVLPPLLMPEGEPPTPESEALVDMCLWGGAMHPVRIYWSRPGEPETPSLQEQARSATGQLELELPPLSTSPATRTLVNLPTWFWIDGGQAEQVGTSAFGLRAVATISSLHVATGDGTTIDCPWTTSSAQAEDDCTYTYRRASNDGSATQNGKPAYTVSATSTWDLRFEMNGVTIDIPGAPTTLEGPASTAVLRVAESQSVVTDAR
jgi:hypothetical protein